MEEILIGLDEIASTLGTGIKTIRKWITKEGLPAIKYSDGIYRISKKSLLEWIMKKEISLKNNKKQ